MSEQKLVIMNVLEGLGELNACLKNLMKATNIDDPKEVIRSINNNEWKFTKVAKAIDEYLESLGNVTFKINQSLDADKFLQSRTGLCVDSNFDKLLGGKASKIKGSSKSSKWLRKKDSSYENIKGELPVNHTYVIGEFRTILASALDKQWGGKVGVLRNDGLGQVFHVWNEDRTICFAIVVDWRSGSEEWSVRVYSLSNQFSADRWVFSRN